MIQYGFRILKYVWWIMAMANVSKISGSLWSLIAASKTWRELMVHSGSATQLEKGTYLNFKGIHINQYILYTHMCIYVYMYTYIYAYIYIYIYIYIHVHRHTYTYVYMYTCIYIYIYIYLYTYRWESSSWLDTYQINPRRIEKSVSSPDEVVYKQWWIESFLSFWSCSLSYSNGKSTGSHSFSVKYVGECTKLIGQWWWGINWGISPNFKPMYYFYGVLQTKWSNNTFWDCSMFLLPRYWATSGQIACVVEQLDYAKCWIMFQRIGKTKLEAPALV